MPEKSISEDNQTIKNKIVEAALKNAAFDGWTKSMLEQSALDAGYEKDMARAVFPYNVKDALNHLSEMVDQQMLEKLEEIDIEPLRIRDRVQKAVEIRLEIMSPNKEAYRLGASHWGTHLSATRAGSAIWNTADKIWIWAGDTTTDYNRYTKRTLLSAVILSTMLYWFQDEQTDNSKTYNFLAHRIENVMQFGKFIGKIKNFGRKNAA